jgi:hypothetical protein
VQLVLAPVPGAAWEYTLALKKDSCIWGSFWKWSDLQVMAFSTRMVWWLGWFGGTSISGNLQILLTESWTINLTQSCLSATFSISNLAASEGTPKEACKNCCDLWTCLQKGPLEN